MPLLKFKCKECNKVFETLISLSSVDTVRCECGGTVERAYEGRCLFGAPGQSAGRGSSCSGNCGGCSGCSGHAH